MKKYYNKSRKEILFCGTKATPEFWDEHWNIHDLKKEITSVSNKNYVINITKNFLNNKNNKKILEGGCGKGQFVYSLQENGYSAYGIDYAEETVKKTKNLFPELKISFDDVRKTNFKDNYFDGYWSLGVIEHFYNGYDDIKIEMYRILKKDGYLFLTFPHMSILRLVKGKLGLYKKFNAKKFNKNKFYQFALNHKNIIADFENQGFSLCYKKRLNGKKGLKDEISFLNKTLTKMYKSKNILIRIFNKMINIFLSPFC